MIIEIYYGPVQFRIVFISWVCYARLFAHCVKLVKYIPPTLEYVKIDWLHENDWIIGNSMFLVLCLVICIFSLFTLL